MEHLLKTFVALLAIVNPLGVVPFFISLTSNYTAEERARTIRTAAFSVAVVIAVCALAGEPVMRFFGISVPALQVGGGIIMLLMAINMLNAQMGGARATAEEAIEAEAKASIAVVPLAIPLLTGPGTISTVIVYAGKARVWSDFAALIGSGVAIGLLVYLLLRLAQPISRLLGRTGINIATRILGLMLAALAVEFMADGLTDLLPGLGRRQ